MSGAGYYRRTESGGWYGGLGFWLVFGIIWLCVMVIVVWVAVILLAAFVVGLGIWSVFEYRAQAKAGLHRPSPTPAEVALVEEELRQRRIEREAAEVVEGLA